MHRLGMSSIDNYSNTKEGWDDVIKNNFNSDDIDLVVLWSDGALDRDKIEEHVKNKKSDAHHIYRLVFARAAENLVIDYYRKYSASEVTDVSVSQLANTNQMWRTHDVKVDDLLLDVKNCTSFHDIILNRQYPTRGNYVSQMKAIDDKHVHIAGVITRVAKRGIDIDQLYLGTVCKPDWVKSVDAVNGLAKRETKITMSYQREYVPAWAYELDDMNPNFNLACIYAKNNFGYEGFVSVAISAGMLDEVNISKIMNRQQAAIALRLNEVISKAGYSKRSIVLFAMSEYLNAILRGLDGAAVIRFILKIIDYPIKYHKLGLYAQSCGGDFRGAMLRTTKDVFGCYDRQSTDQYCVSGMYDPTQSVSHLLEFLIRLSQNIARSSLKFVNFETPNPYILKGITNDFRRLVLYAHCGGQVDDSIACGKFPLMIVDQENCGSCGRLICDDCGYCDIDCDLCQPRQDAMRDVS